MVQPASANKNIWVAASDGDITRVKHLIEVEGLSPNIKDSNSYTPMHAAASYHHFELLEYLLSVGGDINIPDAEGETPLFTVEGVEAARWLVDHGADVAAENDDGQTAADYLEDDHPEIAAYLRSMPSGGVPPAADGAAAVDARAERIADMEADELMLEAQAIMEEAQRTGEDPEGRLRGIVEQAVNRGIAAAGGAEGGAEAEEARKRTRMDGMDD
ncbi:ankyrin repeat-containing domain protein [Dioszegia hungarica]|uniref:Ankyrin repeat-containing domain protein n=1 Tax=Dioszegia hungarica TaxID=4972 RepID=A0AA38LXB0_9TREE|nr:ankyrin repeat-containing domain protein [Dioszegia hungarica]KAI9638308.1 ankyrin repeat-containing domain protein [Dioszegia hungarica]